MEINAERRGVDKNIFEIVSLEQPSAIVSKSKAIQPVYVAHFSLSSTMVLNTKI